MFCVNQDINFHGYKNTWVSRTTFKHMCHVFASKTGRIIETHICKKTQHCIERFAQSSEITFLLIAYIVKYTSIYSAFGKNSIQKRTKFPIFGYPLKKLPIATQKIPHSCSIMAIRIKKSTPYFAYCMERRVRHPLIHRMCSLNMHFI